MKSRRFLLPALGTVAALLSPAQTAAQIRNPVVDGVLGNNAVEAEKGITFTAYFITLWNTIIVLGAITVLIFFVWGAVEWITSGGDKSKLESARNKITQALVGLIVLAGTTALFMLLQQFLDICVLRLGTSC